MLAYLAAGLMQAAVPASPPAGADPDLRCMAAYLFAAGRLSDDPTATAEDKAGATALVMYFFGKVRERRPSSDLQGEIKSLVEAPDYLATQLKHDLDRCGEEFNARAAELNAFGRE